MELIVKFERKGYIISSEGINGLRDYILEDFENMCPDDENISRIIDKWKNADIKLYEYGDEFKRAFDECIARG